MSIDLHVVTIKQNADLLCVIATAMLALTLGNHIDLLGIYSQDDLRLGPGSVLFFLSHDDIDHAFTNLQAAVLYSAIIYAMRRYNGSADDKLFLVAALLMSHFTTIFVFIWLLPPAPGGAHGLSVATSALLGFVLMFSGSSVIRRTRNPEPHLMIVILAPAALAAFFAIAADRHGFEYQQLLGPMRGEIGHSIGYITGISAGLAHALTRQRINLPEPPPDPF